MSNACTSNLVGVVSLVSEILLLSKTAKFPFRPMDYSPWSSKNLIDWNQPKKFMHIRVDVKCMHTNFGGCDFSGFRDCYFQKRPNFPFDPFTRRWGLLVIRNVTFNMLLRLREDLGRG